MSSHYVSYANRIESATLTASSAASGYPVSNLALYNRGLRWRSTAATDSWVVVDLGSAIAFDRFNLIGANFTSFVLQQHTSDSWGAPAWASGTLSTVYDFERRLRRRWYESAANFTRQFTRVFIPTQTPTDGASYFEVESLWAGTFAALPRSPRPDYRASVVDPTVRHEADLGKWAVEYETGDSFVVHRWNRFAEKDPMNPGQGDELGAWLDVDRQIVAAGRRFCHIIEIWGDGAVYVERPITKPEWQDVGLVQARDAWDLEEVVAD
jgi:hypothetical protein